MIEELKKEAEEGMSKVIDALKNSLTKIRTGRASASVLDKISVDYYGTQTPVNQVGQISTPEARLLQIQPFDKSMIESIEKAIIAANIGVNPSNDGNLIRLPFPTLTEERRKVQVKDLKQHGEDSRVSIRNIRRDKNEIIKKAEKDKKIAEDDVKRHQDEIQKITDKYVKIVDDLVKSKESEIISV